MTITRSTQLGQELRGARKAARLTQAQLAKSSGFGSRTTIVAIEKGEREVSTDELYRMQAALQEAIAALPPAVVDLAPTTRLEQTLARSRSSVADLRESVLVVVTDLETDARQSAAVAKFLRRRFNIPEPKPDEI